MKMIAVTYILLLSAAMTHGIGPIVDCIVNPLSCLRRAVTAVMSDGRQLTCEKGPGSPSSAPTREVVTITGDDSLWTCDEVVPSEPTYLKDVKVPKALENGAYAAYLPWLKLLVTCNPMVEGDEAKIGADRRHYIINNTGRNLKFFCEQVPVHQ